VAIRVFVGGWLPGWLLLPSLSLALTLPAPCQTADAPEVAEAETLATVIPEPLIPAPPASPYGQRIMGVIPDYQTVRDTSHHVPPLTAKEKWILAEKETVDPFNIATAFLTAAESQAGNQTPKYGEGYPNFGRRFGAALGDFGTQNLFSAGLLATVFHQDPRYFRKGPQARIVSRVVYSISRLVITPQDSGRSAFNISNVGGMLLGIVASNAYYPAASVRGSVMAGRINTSMMGGAVGNLMSEFWPDLQKKFFHRWFK